MYDGFLTNILIVRVLSTPSEKGAYIITSKDMMLMKSTFKPNFREIPEPIVSLGHGIGVMKNNFIFPLTDKAMGQLLQNGIPQHFLDYMDKFEFHSIPLDVKEPKVFDIDDLAFGFFVFFASCKISLLAFLGELLYFYGKMLIGLGALLRELSKRKLL